MHRYRKGIMQACLQMRTFLYLYRAQARSEKERSGFELGMARKPKGRGPAAMLEHLTRYCRVWCESRYPRQKRGYLPAKQEFELGMAKKPKGRGPAANPNEGGKRWLKSRLLLPVWS